MDTVFIGAEAEREVIPDRVVFQLGFQTPVGDRAEDALQNGITLRKRIREAVEEHHSEEKITDSRIATQAHRVEKQTGERQDRRTEWVVAGYYGVGNISVEAGAEKAASILATVSQIENVSVTSHFFVSRDLNRNTRMELEVEAVKGARERA